MMFCNYCRKDMVFIENDCVACGEENNMDKNVCELGETATLEEATKELSKTGKKIEVNLLLEVDGISESDIEELIKHKVTEAINLAEDYISEAQVELLSMDIKNV